MLLLHRALCRLNQGNAILCIVARAVEAADLRSHFLGDCQPCRVICRAVYAVSAGELLRCLGKIGSYHAKLSVGVH